MKICRSVPLKLRTSKGSPSGRAPAIAGERGYHCNHLPSPSATPPPLPEGEAFYYVHYNKNRQRKQVLRRHLCVTDSRGRLSLQFWVIQTSFRETLLKAGRFFFGRSGVTRLEPCPKKYFEARVIRGADV